MDIPSGGYKNRYPVAYFSFGYQIVQIRPTVISSTSPESLKPVVFIGHKFETNQKIFGSVLYCRKEKKLKMRQKCFTFIENLPYASSICFSRPHHLCAVQGPRGRALQQINGDYDFYHLMEFQKKFFCAYEVPHNYISEFQIIWTIHFLGSSDKNCLALEP